MFIKVEETPNPATLKFLPERFISQFQDPLDYADSTTAKNSPLAYALFNIDGITRVFIGRDFISVTKHKNFNWEELQPCVLEVMLKSLLSEQPIVNEEYLNFQEEDIALENVEIIKQIKELLETRIRPAVAIDGGDIVFRGYNNGIVRLVMRGACSGCPSSKATLKHGVENMLRYYVPEVIAVEQVES